jgi:hypothetical protein
LKKYGEIETEGERDNPSIYLDNLKKMYIWEPSLL